MNIAEALARKLQTNMQIAAHNDGAQTEATSKQEAAKASTE